MQLGTGFLIDGFPADEFGQSPVLAYRIMFVLLAVLLIASMLIYRRIEDVPPSRDTAEPGSD